MVKIFLVLGSLNAFLSVVLGAFGAHALKERLTAESIAIYQTGVQYHMLHAIGIILIAIVSEKLVRSSLIHWSGWLLFIGIVLFSGSLYALSLSGIKILGAITPLGGLAFLAGWILFTIAALSIKEK